MSNSTNSTNISFECRAAQLILAPGYQNLLIVELVAAILTIPPNLLLLSVIWRVVIFCPDLRLVLANFSFVLIWYSVGDILKVVHGLLTPPCGYHMSARTCRIFDSLTVGVATLNIVVSFLVLCIQRLYANLRYKTYDKTHTNWLPLILVASAWAVAAIFQFSDVDSFSVDESVPVCAAIFVPGTWYMFYADCVGEIAAMAIAIFIYIYTRVISTKMGINRAQYDLSARFQVDQNVRNNFMLLPSICLQMLCHIPNFVFLAGTSGFGFWNLSTETKLRLFRYSSMWRLFYAFAHPLLSFIFNVNLRRQLLKSRIGALFGWVEVLKAKKPEEPAVEGHHQTTHFNYLDKIWDKPHQVSNAHKAIGKQPRPANDEKQAKNKVGSEGCQGWL